MSHEFIIVTIKNIFALILYEISNCRVNPKKVGNDKEGIEVLEDEPLIQVAAFYFLYVEALR